MSDAAGLNPGDPGYDPSTDYSLLDNTSQVGNTIGGDIGSGVSADPFGPAATPTPVAAPGSLATTAAGVGSTLSKIGGILTNPNSGLNAIANAGANTAAWNNVAQGYSNGQNTISSTNNQIQGQYQPVVAGATTGVNGLSEIAKTGTPASSVSNYLNPSVSFALGQGQAAIERSAAARGGNLSSGALQDISSYITGQANQNYNSAATLAQNSTSQQIQANQGLATTGTNALNNAANINMQNGQAIAVDQANVGNAYAGGIAGAMAGLNGSSGGGTSNVAAAPAAAPVASGGGGGGGGQNAIQQIGSLVGTVASIASLF